VRFVIFSHSLVSDWNHGNAHFLRGITTELLALGHEVRVFEPRNGWSRQNLLAEHGDTPLAEFAQFYPHLESTLYDESTLDLAVVLESADVVLVHEWNSHELVRRLGEYRAAHPGLRLFFHDTHHRCVTDSAEMARYELGHYDGVLAYGGVIRDLYQQHGWTKAAWTWHEAADTRVFRPLGGTRKDGDLVWIGNWGDGERSAEIREFLIEPVKALGLNARVYGVRYPAHALEQLAEAGIEYAGWLPNYRVPEVFARYKVTVHIPRRPYVESLAGIPTIRPFEALACGIPLISAPWRDSEGLFRPHMDFVMASDGREMIASLQAVLSDHSLARDLAAHGLETIRARHTCAHRAGELLALVQNIPEEALMQGAH